MFGRNNNFFNCEPRPHSLEQVMESDTWKEHWNVMNKTVYPAINTKTDTYNKKLEENFNSTHKILANNFPIGSVVYKKDTAKKTKAGAVYNGPFCVVQRLPDGAYLIRDCTNSFFPKPVNAKHLKLAIHTEMKDENIFEVGNFKAPRRSKR